MVNLQLSKVLHSLGPLSPCGTCRTRYSAGGASQIYCPQICEASMHPTWVCFSRRLWAQSPLVRISRAVNTGWCWGLRQRCRILSHTFPITLYHFDQNWFHLRKHSVYEVPNFLLPCIKVGLSAPISEWASIVMCLGLINVVSSLLEWSPPRLLAAFLSLSLISIVSPRHFRSAAPHLSLWIWNICSTLVSFAQISPWMSWSCSLIPLMVSPMESIVILRLSISEFLFHLTLPIARCSALWLGAGLSLMHLIWSIGHLHVEFCLGCPVASLPIWHLHPAFAVRRRSWKMGIRWMLPSSQIFVDPFTQSSGLFYKILTVQINTFSKQTDDLE